jgi:hypothetical protein
VAGREGFIPARRADLYPGSYSAAIYPRKKYAGRRYKRFPLLRRLLRRGRQDHATLPDLENPPARHETRRIGKAAGVAAAGSFEDRSA